MKRVLQAVLFVCSIYPRSVWAEVATRPTSRPTGPLDLSVSVDFSKREVSVRFTNAGDKEDVFFIGPECLQFTARHREVSLVAEVDRARRWVNLPYAAGTLPLEDGEFIRLKPGASHEMTPMPLMWLQFSDADEWGLARGPTLMPATRPTGLRDERREAPIADEGRLEVFVAYKVSGRFWDSAARRVVSRASWTGEVGPTSIGVFDALAIRKKPG